MPTRLRPTLPRRTLVSLAAVGALCLTTIPAAAAPADPAPAAASSAGYVVPEAASTVADLSAADMDTLRRYLADTWTSLDEMTDPATGLPADNIGGALAAESRSSYTSPTNIGGYLWSAVVARDAGLITAAEARERMSVTLTTLAGMQRHEASGMYYNWYNPATGTRLDTWPESGDHINQFLSSVDNGWLAASLRIVAKAEPALADQANALYDSMNFGVYYNPDARPDLGVGLIRGGFWDTEPVNQGGWVLADYLNTGTSVYYTGHHYDTTVSETRIALYLGIANGQIPAKAYYATWRAFPSTCDWDWQEQRASGVTRTYDGIDVFEGVYHYRGMSIVPGWGGSMFEALMPDMLVPEVEWGPNSWGVNHPLVVRAQKEHGLDEAGYGMWGFSPASNPHGGYLEYGVDQLGLNSGGYFSDGTTDVDGGFFGCRDATNAAPTYGDGVVTPHASFLGVAFDPVAVLSNAAALEAAGAYGPGGFYDAIAVRTGTIAKRYLSLDQSMIVAALGNFLDNGVLRSYFVAEDLESTLRPVMAAEVFSSSASDVVPAIETPAHGSSQAPGATTFTGRGEPGAELSVTNADAGVCTASVAADGRWSCSAELTDGQYALTATTTDLAGITTTATPVEITVSSAAPTPINTATSGAARSGDPSAATSATSAGASARPLASTGAPVLLVAGVALVLLVGGGALVIMRRRRAHS